MKNRHFKSMFALIVSCCFLSGGAVFSPLFIKASAQAGTQHDGYHDLVRLIGKGEHLRAVEFGLSLLSPKTEQRFEFFERLAQAAKLSGRLEETRIVLARLVLQNPANVRLSYGLALVQLESGNSQLAIAALKECVRQLPEEPLPMLSLIHAFHRLAQPQAAADFLAEALKQNPENFVARLGKALHLNLLKEYQSAVEEVAIAVRLAPTNSLTCLYQSQFMFQAVRLKETIGAAKQCLLVTGEPELEIRRDLLLGLGTAQAILGETTASEHLLSARAISVSLEDKPNQRLASARLGSTYWAQDFYSEAVSEYKQAIALSIELSDRLNEGTALANLGSLYLTIGNYEAAEKSLRQSWSILSTFPDDEPYVTHKVNIWARIGILQTEQGNFENAIKSYNESLRYEELRKPQAPQASTFNALAGLYLKTGGHSQARGDQQQARADYVQARTLIEKARSLDSGQMLEPSLITLALSGEVHFRCEELAEAEKDFQKLLEHTEHGKNPHHRWKALAGLAAIWEKQHQRDAALAFYRQAIKEMESVRVRLAGVESRALFFQDKVVTYHRMAGLLMKLKKDSAQKGDLHAAQTYATEALEITERARARSLLDSLSQITRNLATEIPQDLKIERLQIQTRFSETESKLRIATAEKPMNTKKVKALEEDLKRDIEALSQWQIRLRQRNPKYADLQYPEPLKLEQVQQMLRGN